MGGKQLGENYELTSVFTPEIQAGIKGGKMKITTREDQLKHYQNGMAVDLNEDREYLVLKRCMNCGEPNHGTLNMPQFISTGNCGWCGWTDPGWDTSESKESPF